MLKDSDSVGDSGGKLTVDLDPVTWNKAGVNTASSDVVSGAASANVTVFKQQIVEGGASIAELRLYLKAAMAAGWGVTTFASDPLVLDLDGDGIELWRQSSGVYFDLDNDGFAEKTAWVRPDDGFLVRDLNANGTIDNITEMFGNATTSGFVHLAALDSNADSKITAADTGFGTLKVWRDLDGDGVTDRRLAA